MRRVNLNFSNIIETTDYYWIFERLSNCICQLSKDFNEIKYICHVDDNYFKNEKFIQDIYLQNDCILLFYQNSRDVIIYNIKSMSFEICECPDKSECRMHQVVEHNNKFYYIPQDIKDYFWEFDYITLKFKTYEGYTLSEQNSFYSPYFYKDNDTLFFCAKAECVTLDLNSFLFREVLFLENADFLSVCVNDNCIWLTQRNSFEMVRFFDKTVEKYLLSSDKGIVEPFSTMGIWDDKVVVLPRHNANLFIFDSKTKETAKIPVYSGSRKEGEPSFAYRWIKNENSLYLLPTNGSNIIALDKRTNSIQYIETYCDFVKMSLDKANSIVYENDKNDFLDFINTILSREGSINDNN